MLSDALTYGTARVASAGLSFLLFALVARYCSAEDTKAIYFFSFAFGFLVAALRSFANLGAGLHGGSRTAHKLRTVLTTSGHLLMIQPVTIMAAVFVFWAHPISTSLVVIASVAVAVAAFDSDLLRAALNRGPFFAVLFAVGGALALGIFLVSPTKTVEIGCAAMLVQWIPASLVNLYLYVRLFRRRSRVQAIVRGIRGSSVVGTLAVSLFDGAVLNAPFLTGSRVGAAAGLDLSVAMRIFVSSLALVPLMMHWSNTQTLGRAATRVGVTEPQLYAAAVMMSGGFGGLALAGAYVWASGKPITFAQYVLSVLLLISYTLYATSMRYNSAQVSATSKVVVLAGLLAVFLGLFVGATSVTHLEAPPIVALQAATLLTSGFLVSRLKRRPATSPVRSDR